MRRKWECGTAAICEEGKGNPVESSLARSIYKHRAQHAGHGMLVQKAGKQGKAAEQRAESSREQQREQAKTRLLPT